MRWKSHVRCGGGEKKEIVSSSYLFLYLDSKTTEEVMDLLKISSEKFNQTLIIITHDNNIAKKADKVIYIIDGEIKKTENSI